LGFIATLIQLLGSSFLRREKYRQQQHTYIVEQLNADDGENSRLRYDEIEESNNRRAREKRVNYKLSLC
jgi:hypothetical protein